LSPDLVGQGIKTSIVVVSPQQQAHEELELLELEELELLELEELWLLLPELEPEELWLLLLCELELLELEEELEELELEELELLEQFRNGMTK
jgi:hypothetical protein